MITSCIRSVKLKHQQAYTCCKTLQDRPDFAEIIPILEEVKQSPAVSLLSNPAGYQQMSLSASLPAVIRDHESDGEGGRATPPLAGNVSALKSRWEQEVQRNR